MTLDVARSILNSKALREYALIVFNPAGKSFDAVSIAQSIEEIKLNGCTKNSSYSNGIIQANLRLCLQSLQFYNATLSRINSLKATIFDYGLESHTELLDSLWSHLMPDMRREPATKFEGSSQFASASWKDIGFQGKIPTSHSHSEVEHLRMNTL